MRTAIISDIHSNLEALTATCRVLDEAGYDKMVCLGDVVGYGPSPNECAEFIRSRNIPCLRGNHDNFIIEPDSLIEKNTQDFAIDAIKWTRKVLKPDNRDWLASLPYLENISPNLTIVHASLEIVDGYHWPYILDIRSATMHFLHQVKPFAACGHSHIPLLFTFNTNSHKTNFSLLSSAVLDLCNYSRFYLINPGSVGQPRDYDNRASAVILDDVSGELKHFRIGYDFRTTQDRIMEAGLPAILAARLGNGC